MEKTIRGNGKWAKVSGKAGSYTVALGWEGQFKASKVLTMTKKTLAMCYAEGWLAD